MSNPPEDHTAESPIQRALRLKRAAQAAKPKARGAAFNAREAARAPSGASRPWTKT